MIRTSITAAAIGVMAVPAIAQQLTYGSVD